MNRVVDQILRNRLVNTCVRYPLKALISGSSIPFMKSLLLRIPVVGKFKVRLPDGNRILIDTLGPELDPIGRKLFWWGFRSHEPETTRVFYELARRCSTVFDVGANMGYFSLLASLANREARIFAFEPEARIFEGLKRNIQLNQAINVVPVPAAVTNRDGKATLYVSKGGTSSLIQAHRDPDVELEVPAVTLDSYVRQHEIDKVDLVKVDVEKGEPEVFEGMEETLGRDSPDIICEVLGKSDRILTDILSDYGYSYYWISGDGLIRRNSIVHDGDYQYLNYLLTKPRNEHESAALHKD